LVQQKEQALGLPKPQLLAEQEQQAELPAALLAALLAELLAVPLAVLLAVLPLFR
jgi:hypothetical protein